MNSAIARQRWPDLYKDLLNIQKEDHLDISWSDTPEPTLVCDGIFLESGYDKSHEAALQARLVPDEAPKAWIYGLGTGALAAKLLERPELKELNVVLLNRQLAAYIIHHVALPWLDDPRVHLVGGAALTKVRTPFAALPGCLRLADHACARIRDMVQLELSSPFIREQHHQKSGRWIAARIRENSTFFHNDRPVSELFNKERGSHILVAAAGPTLDQTMERLRFLRENAALVSVDAALVPLLEAGIYPDYTITIDPQPAIRTFFDTDLSPLANTALIYFPSVDPQVIRTWPGRRYVAWSEYLRRLAADSDPAGECLFSAGSVIHPAVDLAVRMGAATITLFGADFSFPHNQTHAAKCSQAEPFTRGHATHTLLNGHGVLVATTPNLRGYLRDLETYIERFRDHPIVWRNASRDGALIQGCSFLEEENAQSVHIHPSQRGR